MPTMRLLPFLLLALCVFAPPAAAIEPGDLLVVDQANDRILQVGAGDGSVSTFSPRSATNLLDAPRSIATAPDGEVLVLNGGAVPIVGIDPVSGAQSDATEGALLDLGTDPAGIDLPLPEPGPGEKRTVYVGATAELREIVRDASPAANQLGAYPAPYDSASANAVAVRNSIVSPLEVYVATDAALLLYQGSQGTITPFWEPGVGTITGVDFAGPLLVTRQAEACPSPSNGIYLYRADLVDFEPYATGGDLGCPGAIAVNPPSSGVGSAMVYAIAEGASDSIVQATLEQPPQVSVLVPSVSGPATPDLVDLAVYLPEPESGVLAGLAALGLLARRRGRAA